MLVNDQDTNKLVREKALKRLEELSLKFQKELVFGVDGNVYRNGKPIAVEPNYFQKAWFVRRMRGPAKSWKRWNQE
jgi:hypothetical protein